MPALPRLTIFATTKRLNTFRQVRQRARAFGFRARLIGYEQAVRRQRLPGGTALFTDFERMAPPWLEAAALLRARVAETGAPVLNDPARFLPRAALLRALHREGINRFGCWLPVLGEAPERFPVFLRTGWAHRGVIGDLLESPEAAAAALEAALAAGHGLGDLMFIEYAGLEREGAVFRKRAAYGVAGQVVPAATVSHGHWVAKQGTKGAATDAQYAQDRAAMADYPWEALVRRVMAVAGQDFGRVDFGLTAEGPAVFELNTNPYIRRSYKHPNADRLAGEEQTEARLMAALADQAARGADAPPVSLKGAFGWRGRLRMLPKMP